MTSLAAGPALLQHAVRYALASAAPVTAEMLARPTPCAGWNLHRLRSHICESLDALCEGFSAGYVGPAPPEPGTAADCGLADDLTGRAARLLAACSAAPPGRLITIVNQDLTTGVLAATGAIEIAVHSWDLCVTCGGREPIPAGLASGLLELAPLLVTAGTRDGLFADPVPAAPTASPGHRLVAFLGRDPAWPAVPG
jgi:uncharacterized protein (TIGR03086 family)